LGCPKQCPVDALRSLLTLYSYEQVVNSGTHVYPGINNESRTTTIDLICANRPHLVENAMVVDFDPGQLDYHKPVLIQYKATAPPLKKHVRKERNFSQANIEKFTRLLGTKMWFSDSAEDLVLEYNNTLVHLLNTCFPIKEYIIAEKALPHITPEIRAQISIKYQLLQRKRDTHRNEDRVAYNRQCDYVRLLCSQHRSRSMIDEISQNLSNSRKLWQTIKYYLPVGKAKCKAPIKLLKNGTEIANELDVACEFNSFFVSVAQDLADQIAFVEGDPLDFVPAPRDGATFSLHQIVERDVELEIIAISDSKAIAEPIPMRVLKRVTNHLVTPLTQIINKSFSEASVPVPLKNAIVSCIFKDGEKTNVANYRGISVLPLPAKIMESIVQKRLSIFLEERHILYDFQSAYRKNHSCEMALNETLAKIYKELDQANEALVVFLDLRRAFDTIDRNILFRKLERIGIRGHSLTWFKSLLSGRTQSVKIGSQTSQPLAVQIGVPQGAGLGPLLFSLYINDISRACNIPETLLFADDTALVYSGDVSSATINASLSRFFRWLCLNKLTLNTAKTKFMLFSKKRNPSEPVIAINGVRIEQVDEIKYLGITIDNHLSFGSHLDKTAKKLNFLHSVLFNNKSMITPAVGNILIQALAIPKLQYCSSVFHLAPYHGLSKLDVIYRKLIKTTNRLDYDTTAEIVYKTAKFLPLCLLRQIQAATFAFRCETGISATYLRQSIVTTDDQHVRRRPEREAATPVERYVVPRCRIEVTAQSYATWAPRILNILSEEFLVSCRDSNDPVKSFTRKYKHLIQEEFSASFWERRFEVQRPLRYFARRIEPG
jgi:hypothetical protein